MSERGVHHVLNRQVEVRVRGHHDRVLARGLRKKLQVRAERVEQFGGFVSAGEDKSVHARVGYQLATQFVLAHMHEVQHVARDPAFIERRPDRLDHHRTTPLRLSRRFDHDGGTRRERRQGRPRRDCDGEVPRRGHHS